MVEALLKSLKWVLLCLLPFYLGVCLFVCGAMWLTTGFDSIAMELPIIAILSLPLAGMMAAAWHIPLDRRQ